MRTEEKFNAVRARLADLRRSIRWMFFAHGMARVVMAAALLLIWHFLTDTFLELPVELRLAMLVVMAAVLVVVTVRRVAYPLSRVFSEEELALLVEKEYPLLNERLITAFQIFRDRERYRDIASDGLAQAAVDEGLDVALKLRFKEVVQSGRLFIATGFAAVAVAAFATLFVLDRETAGIWGRRFMLAEEAYPRRTALDVRFPRTLDEYPTTDVIDLNFIWDAGSRHIRVARNSGLRVVVEPRGVKPDRATLYIDAPGAVREERMEVEYRDNQRGEREVAYYHFNIPAVLHDRFSLRIEAGDGEAGPFEVQAVKAPALESDTVVRYSFPSYMQRDDASQHLDRSLRAPAGSRAELSFRTSAPLAADGARVRVAFAGADPEVLIAQAEDTSNTRFRVSLVLDPAMVEYEYLLQGADGLHNTESYKYSVRVEEDRPPEVSFDFYGKGLDDESRVPVTLRGQLPLRFTVKDLYGVKKRALKYRLAGDAAAEWREFMPFALHFEERGHATRSILKAVQELDALLDEFGQSVRGGAPIPDPTRMVGRADELRAQVSGNVAALMRIAQQTLRPLDDGTVHALASVQTAWDILNERFLADVSVERITRTESSRLREVFTSGRKLVEAMRDATRQYHHASSTAASDEYLLSIKELLASTPFTTENRVDEEMKLNGGHPVGLELQIVAEDYNYNELRSQGGVGLSRVANLDLTSVEDLMARISRYIRGMLKEDLTAIIASQKTTNDKMLDFVRKQYGLGFGHDEEGRKARAIMSAAQLEQGSLPDETLRLAERFGNVAQAYIFNELEYDEVDKPQENRIQTARVVLLLLTVAVARGDTVAAAMLSAKSDPSDARRRASVDEVLAELELDAGMTGVRESFDRLSFAGILKRSEYKEPSTLRRLDLLYDTMMRPDSTSETRRASLDAILIAQQQTLAGLEIVLERLSKWEGFEALRISMRNLAQDERDLHKAISEIFK